MKKLFLIIFIFLTFEVLGQDSENITFLGSFSAHQCNAIAATSNYAFITEDLGFSQNGNLKILNIVDPSSISVAGSYYGTDHFQPTSVTINGNYAFIGSSYQDLRIVDIANISSPQLIIRYEEYCTDIQIEGNIAYLASQTEGLIILNISNLNEISEIGYYESQGDALTLFIKGNFAYLTYGTIGLRIVDISNIGDPVQVGFYDTPGLCNGVYVTENYLFLADGHNGLLIIDLSNLDSINQVSQYKEDSLNFSIKQVIVANNFAYLADRGFGVRILDLSDILLPKQVGYYKIDQGSNKICLAGNRIYSINENGLTILKNDLITNMKNETKSLPTQYSLSQNYPNPFNPSTMIKFGIPKESNVTLEVYNLLGQEVTQLVNQQLKAGYHEVEFNNSNLTSGIYFYRLQAGEFADTKKMLLLR